MGSLGHQQVAADLGQLFEFVLNLHMSFRIALDHEHCCRLGRSVRVAGSERRGRRVLSAELNRLRNLRSRKLGQDMECEVDARGDAACRETIAIAHDARALS
jgi:hypothetical protein